MLTYNLKIEVNVIDHEKPHNGIEKRQYEFFNLSETQYSKLVDAICEKIDA